MLLHCGKCPPPHPYPYHVSLTSFSPIGVVAGSVNKPNQTAAEIVKEMVAETVVALNSAQNFVNAAAKL